MYVGGNPIMYTDPTGHEGKATPKNPFSFGTRAKAAASEVVKALTHDQKFNLNRYRHLQLRERMDNLKEERLQRLVQAEEKLLKAIEVSEFTDKFYTHSIAQYKEQGYDGQARMASAKYSQLKLKNEQQIALYEKQIIDYCQRAPEEAFLHDRFAEIKDIPGFLKSSTAEQVDYNNLMEDTYFEYKRRFIFGNEELIERIDIIGPEITSQMVSGDIDPTSAYNMNTKESGEAWAEAMDKAFAKPSLRDFKERLLYKKHGGVYNIRNEIQKIRSFDPFK